MTEQSEMPFCVRCAWLYAQSTLYKDQSTAAGPEMCRGRLCLRAALPNVARPRAESLGL